MELANIMDSGLCFGLFGLTDFLYRLQLSHRTHPSPVIDDTSITLWWLITTNG